MQVVSQCRKFSAAYKDEAGQLVVQSGRPVAVVARELGIQDGTSRRWGVRPQPQTPIRLDQNPRASPQESQPATNFRHATLVLVPVQQSLF